MVLNEGQEFLQQAHAPHALENAKCGHIECIGTRIRLPSLYELR
jgi:hypothetical protein